MIIRQSALLCRGIALRGAFTTLGTCPKQCLRTRFVRWQSSAAGSRYLYPESLRVFHAPTGQTMLYGYMRVLTGFVWYAGSFLYAPYVYFNPDMETWKVPLILLAAPLPMLASCLFGPYVSAINIHIPSAARRSQEALMQFASNIPPKTKVSFVYMRFRPWPHRMSASFDELRRITKRSGTTWAANLELLPKVNEAKMKSSPIYAWFIQKYMGEYWVNVEQNRNAVPRPDVWQKIWHQIPAREAAARKQPEQKKVMRQPTIPSPRPARTKRP